MKFQVLALETKITNTWVKKITGGLMLLYFLHMSRNTLEDQYN